MCSPSITEGFTHKVPCRTPSPSSWPGLRRPWGFHSTHPPPEKVGQNNLHKFFSLDLFFLAWHFRGNEWQHRAGSKSYMLEQTVFSKGDHNNISHSTCFSMIWCLHASPRDVQAMPSLESGWICDLLVIKKIKMDWKWCCVTSKGLSHKAMQLLPCQLGHWLLEPLPPLKGAVHQAVGEWEERPQISPFTDSSSWWPTWQPASTVSVWIKTLQGDCTQNYHESPHLRNGGKGTRYSLCPSQIHDQDNTTFS